MQTTKDDYNQTLTLRICILIGFCMASMFVSAQKMSVESFELIEKDLTANTSPTMKMDFNGEKCAIIKIQTNQHNFMFDVGTLGVVETVSQNSDHPGEIWLYVPAGVKKITIQHPVFEPINDYDLGQNVKKGKTYLLKLTTDQVNTLVVDYENSQYLRTQIEPKDATFYINGLRQPLDANGVSEIPLTFGTHNYRVTSKNYHPKEGQIVINNKEKKHVLNINLKQAFGYLTVGSTHDMDGAEIYIDDTKVGQIPLNQFPVKSGSHTLTVTKKLFLPHTENFAMTDSGFVNITPELNPNYSEVSLSVPYDKDAQIYDNGELLGQGSWHGRLEAGKHILEAKKISHGTTSKELEILPNHIVDLVLENPSPIYGSLELTSSPKDAEVIIDGKQLGKTPFIDNRILVGKHTVELRLKGYKSETKDVVINEGVVTRENVELTDFCTASITTIPAYATLNINDRRYSQSQPLNIEAGKYNVKVTAHGYSPYNKTLRLDGTTKNFPIRLNRDFTRKNEFYIQAGYNITALSGINIGLGCYIQNVNIEGNYMASLSSSDKIYWSDTSGESVPFTATYKPSGGNVKIGYGFRINSRIRITPQFGFQFLSLKENTEESFISEDYTQWSQYYLGAADKASAASASFGARFSFALAPCIGVSVSPEYLVSVSKSEGYKALSAVSSKIKGYTEGFSCNISVNLFF